MSTGGSDTPVAAEVQVHMAESATSGFASILEQFLRQNLEEFEEKRRRALSLRGHVVMTASDHDSTVTIGLGGRHITIWDGAREPADAAITGPYALLIGLLQGKSNPLVEHLRGRIKIRSSLRKPFLPLRVHYLMRLEPEGERPTSRLRLIAAASVAAAVVAVAGGLVLISGG